MYILFCVNININKLTKWACFPKANKNKVKKK